MSSSEEGEYLFSSSESEIELGPVGVLPVAKFSESFTPDSTPSTGEEYLCQVRHQSKNFKTLICDGGFPSECSTFPIVSFEPLCVTKEQVDNVKATYTGSERANMVREAVKGSFSALCTVTPRVLKPCMLSDIRSHAKLILNSEENEDISYVILVGTIFGQHDLIKLI